MLARPPQPPGSRSVRCVAQPDPVRAITDEARRRRGFIVDLVRLEFEPSEADSSSALADRDEIARVFGRLSVEHRTIVVLHHYLGMTTDEAARAIGVPPGTAKSRLHYATEALRAALEADERSITAGRALA